MVRNALLNPLQICIPGLQSVSYLFQSPHAPNNGRSQLDYRCGQPNSAHRIHPAPFESTVTDLSRACVFTVRGRTPDALVYTNLKLDCTQALVQVVACCEHIREEWYVQFAAGAANFKCSLFQGYIASCNAAFDNSVASAQKRPQPNLPFQCSRWIGLNWVNRPI
jgi:hypothetical protein